MILYTRFSGHVYVIICSFQELAYIDTMLMLCDSSSGQHVLYYRV